MKFFYKGMEDNYWYSATKNSYDNKMKNDEIMIKLFKNVDILAWTEIVDTYGWTKIIFNDFKEFLFDDYKEMGCCLFHMEISV